MRLSGAELASPPWATDAEATGDGDVAEIASVRVDVPDLCPRFTARAFVDVAIGPSPLWLKARLIAAGQRPINNVVDITNYVMLLTGQPLHAFDLDEVPGRRDHRAGGRRGRAYDDARRGRAHARRRERRRLRSRRPDGDRRNHGRAGLRGLGDDDPGAARGRHLERHQHPAHLQPAVAALRGIDAVREAAPSRADDAGAARRPRSCSSSSAARGWCRARSTPTRTLRGWTRSTLDPADRPQRLRCSA